MDPRRQAILKEAQSWVGTAYHHMGRVKGVGADCLTFIVEVYVRAGIVSEPEIPFYRPDFMRHQNRETYLEGVLEYGHEVEVPLPGDVALFKWGRIYAHGGIVTAWPWIFHAAPQIGVIRMRGNEGKLRGREVKFISAFNDGTPA